MRKRAVGVAATALAVACHSADWGGPGPSLVPGSAEVARAPEVPAAPVAQLSDDRPRLFLSDDVRTALRARAAANTPEWAALHARCDGYLPGKVEFPDGADYPGKGNVGEGYQGQGYFVPLLELSLCHQIDPRALGYAQKGVEILRKMSEPEGAHAPKPERDSVYGIRFFGVGMAIAYDWLYAEMSSDDRRRIAAALERWITAYEKSGFGRDHPQGNYFAGYYSAKALAALATESREGGHGDKAWRDFLERVHLRKVAPFYAAHMEGGGWPEGWGYGTLASLNMSLPSWAAKTAKGIDLVRGTDPAFGFPLDQAHYLMHFSWPSKKTLDDRGTHHASDAPSAFDPMLAYAAWWFASVGGDPLAPSFHRFAREVREASGVREVEPWAAMLFWDEQAPEATLDNVPRSYVARGMQSVAMRSSWDRNAVWASFSAGPYVNNPDSGEMLFDQGSLSVVRGDKPLLVYAPTALIKSSKGTQDGARLEQKVYDSLFGDKAERSLFNVFYAKTGNVPRYGQIANPAAKTALGRYEDRGAFVAVRGDRLEEVYRPGTVVSWSRQVVYLRPSLFVIEDRTEALEPRADQWLAFHTSRPLLERGNGSWDVGDDQSFAGRLTTLLPRGNKTKVVDLFSANKVWRAEVHAASPRARQTWLTVFDAADSRERSAQSALLTFSEGKAEGVTLRTKEGNSVVVFATNDAPLSYAAWPGVHVIADLPPDSAYDVTARSGQLHVTRGGKLKASHEGVLAFTVQQNGKIDAIP